MRQISRVLLCAVWCVVIAAHGVIAKVLPEAKQLAESYKGKSLYLRRSLNQCPKVYLQTQQGHFLYEQTHGRLFPVREPVQITVSSVSSVTDLVFHVKSEHLGSTTLTLRSVDGEPITAEAVQATITRGFTASSPDDVGKLYLGRSSTRTLHVDGCNHMPVGGDVMLFATVEEAKSAGYHECSICFYKTPTISGYEEEYLIGQRVAAMIRDYHAPVTDDEPNSRVLRIGNAILSKWPTPLKGYSYSFNVIEDPAPNAVACPGGEIFVTTGLLNAVESDEELEGVLAHEITHVEMRHGYRQYKSAKRAQTVSAIAGILGGVIAGAASKDHKMENATFAADLITIVGNVSAAIALSGYSRGYEEEADSYALAYMATKASSGSTESFVSTLRKLSYYSDVVEASGGGMGLFNSHPNIESRVDKASQVDVKMIPSTVFRAIDNDGETVATITFDMQTYASYKKNARTTSGDKSELRVFATLETTQNLGKSSKVMSVSLQTKGGRFLLDNKEDTEVLPSDLVGFTFSSNSADGFIDEIAGIELSLPNVSSWVRQE